MVSGPMITLLVDSFLSQKSPHEWRPQSPLVTEEAGTDRSV